jgi:hypothetical protein
MPDDPKRFRDRAKECRAIAKGARSQADAALLEQIAEQMDDEARLIENQSRGS